MDGSDWIRPSVWFVKGVWYFRVEHAIFDLETSGDTGAPGGKLVDEVFKTRDCNPSLGDGDPG